MDQVPPYLQYLVDAGMEIHQRWGKEREWYGYATCYSVLDGNLHDYGLRYELTCTKNLVRNESEGWTFTLGEVGDRQDFAVDFSVGDAFRNLLAHCGLLIGDWHLSLHDTYYSPGFLTKRSVHIGKNDWDTFPNRNISYDETLWIMLADVFFQGKNNIPILIDYLQEMDDEDMNRRGIEFYEILNNSK